MALSNVRYETTDVLAIDCSGFVELFADFAIKFTNFFSLTPNLS